MIKAYVAHPYGGVESCELAVEKIIKRLNVKDSDVLYISPIHALGYLYTAVSYNKGMDYCYELLQMCNYIILCPGWEKSTGCCLEKVYAIMNNIPIKYYKKGVVWDA